VEREAPEKGAPASAGAPFFILAEYEKRGGVPYSENAVLGQEFEIQRNW